MAASTKPTAVHFALVFFVMTTLILALVCYLTAKEFAAAELARNKAADEKTTAQQVMNTALNEVTLLKKKLGYSDFEAIGTETDSAPNTVVGAINRDLAQYGREQVQPSAANPTVAATLQSLRSVYNAEKTKLAETQAALAKVQADLDQEKKAHTQRAKQLQDSQTSSETQLKDLVTQRNELVAEKDAEIGKWRDEFRREQREKEGLKDELEAVRKSMQEQIHDLENVVTYLRQKLNELEDLSFDVADGEIVRVDNTTRAVWINLGSDDGLRSQVSFAVYTQSHNGFGRGNADIKAKIEVTKIRGPHLAEARILQEELGRPIQAGDPIYTPAWSKGAKEYFSFVGVVDLDGDDKSDRAALHTILDNAGAGVELEIDDHGNRVPEGAQLTVKSKFLVIGRIEDPTEYPGSDTEKQEEVRKSIQEYNELTKEALRKGIKTVNFRDFLNYIGYEQQQRLYRAGEDRPFNLKYGARSTGTDEVLGSSRLSNGSTSARFKSDSKAIPKLPSKQ
jgi:hypothetical protein